MRIDFSCPAIIAHRGTSRFAPENTLSAFRLAAQQGADAIELDVKLSRDGQVMVIHDSTLDRTTSGTGPVAAHTLEELKRLDARGSFGEQYDPTPIPTLLEVLESLGGQINLNIELTNYASPTNSLPEKVVKLVKSLKLEDMIVYSSFNPRAFVQVRRLDPESRIGLLARQGKGTTGAWARSPIARLLPHTALHPHFQDVTPALVTQVHKSGKKIFTYTVNQIEEMLTQFNLSVDGIFTNDPALGRQMLIEFHQTT